MPRCLKPAIALLALTAALGAAAAPRVEYRRLPLKTFMSKMKAGWLGQIAGVSLGAPTEFRWQDKIIPDDECPRWQPKLINDAFAQDDLYVEMTFLRTMEQYGLGVSIRQAGLDFANSRYSLWCANNAGRTNLRRGIAPPDSGHPKFNKCPNDIDYQIEADYSGLIAPGMPQAAVDLGEKFGRLMNYGDGLYAGQFVGAMYAAAYFYSDPVVIVEEALKAIPAQSQYAEMVRDMLAWYRNDPDDWQATWRLCQAKYRLNPEYQKSSNGGIDCKINGAYVLLGLLYGHRDPEATMRIACRGGMDSDCNPSSAAGVLFTALGMEGLDPRFYEALELKPIFSHTAYNVPRLLEVCRKLAVAVLRKNGGRIVRESGVEMMLIPVRPVKPTALELSWAPGPITGARYTPAEMRKVTMLAVSDQVLQGVKRVLPGWTVRDCGPDMDPGFRAEYEGKKNVVLLHPLDQEIGCTLKRVLAVPADGAPTLRIVVARDTRGDFDLVVKVDGKEALRKPMTKEAAPGCWATVTVDLGAWKGKQATVEIVNQPSGWSFEAAYFAEIALVQRP
jgi:hypothetical protein